jgi:hypothetical protein
MLRYFGACNFIVIFEKLRFSFLQNDDRRINHICYAKKFHHFETFSAKLKGNAITVINPSSQLHSYPNHTLSLAVIFRTTSSSSELLASSTKLCQQRYDYAILVRTSAILRTYDCTVPLHSVSCTISF